MTESTSSLTIVIPALNEEEAIGATIGRCLEARKAIRSHSGVGDIEIVVVSDGSTDQTESIALDFDEVTVLAFNANRGYGAAIKTGFEAGSGNLVGFLDADGTCDPVVFGQLCLAIEQQGAHVAIGSRMSSESRMPWIRVVGNTLFAWLLGLLSKRPVGDVASGMRVIRRDRLPDLYPLPDGLHFTPAMSARVLIEDRLKIVEVPMPYAERVGRSKLSVVRDGFRFLRAILRAAVLYRPARLLLLMAGGLALAALLVGFGPVLMYLREARIEEWMIYRILLASLLTTIVALLLCGAIVAEQISAITFGRPAASVGVTGLVARLFSPRARRVGIAALLSVAAVLVGEGIGEYLGTGHVTLHWSRVVLAALLVVMAGVLLVTTFLLNMMKLIRIERLGTGEVQSPDRERVATRGP